MDFKTRLLRYYELRCPSKCNDVDKLVIKYKGKEKELFRQLTFKYGPEDKLSNADRTAINNRAPQKKIVEEIDKQINYDEWMNSLLNNDDLLLLNEIDKYNSKSLPKHILDKI